MFRFSALYQNNGNITEDNRNEGKILIYLFFNLFIIIIILMKNKSDN